MNLDKGLVAVTGPNGSGKSNILDAIMFAIGENSPKVLRVDKLQSLFHDGGNSNHRLVRVSLTFDNTDRGIPVDSDNVTLSREMEGQKGESTYLLNGKAVSKATIMELLEVVLAAPNKLNIVQQGMITRISELNSEDRRNVVEEIVGLSYFDEKKAESIKQLDEADRRLEIAFARMGEIRKRIDELEAERNDHLRHDQISSELKRFRAVQVSNSIRTVRQKLATSNAILDENNQRSSLMAKQLDEIRQEIEKLEAEKTKFIQEVDLANRAKAQVTTRISATVLDSERSKAMLAESERRTVEIERRLPAIETSVQSLSGRVATMQSEAETFRTTVAQKNAEVMQLKTKIDMINAEVERIGSAVAKYASFRQRLETRLSKMTSLKGRLEIAAATLEEKIKTNSYRTSANEQSMLSLQSEIGTSRKKISDLVVQLDVSRRRLEGIAEANEELGVARSDLQKEVERSSILAARAGTLAMKFEERASVAKNAMSEDFAIADLMKDSDKFGIVDLVHDMIKWDRDYERAVLAAGSEWMKAFVVDDVNSMILIAAYAKEKRLPRLKIIPLDVVGRYRPRPDMPNDDVTVLGRLSDFVYSDYDGKLPEFLFSDTILTRTSTSAYLLARQGYRSVSVDGELFEPAGGSVSLDFGGKISDFTEAILLGDSVETLRETIAKLSALIEKKDLQIREMSGRIADSEAEKVKLELVIENNASGLRAERELLVAKESSAAQMIATSDMLQSEQSALTSEFAKLQRRLSLLGPSIQSVTSRMQGMSDESSSKNELATMNVERNQVIRSLDSATISLSQSAAMLGGIDSRLELESGQLAQLQDEKQRLLLELEQRKRQAEDLRMKSQSAETELKALRDQEQQVIDSSGNAYTVLQEYEQKIKALSDSERKKSKEHSLVEKESALLRKDVSDLAGEESRLTNDLVWLGYKNLLEEMDVAFMIKELSHEFEAVSKSINLRADESYVQVIDGYRSMSGRKNQLENERNSIVSFIQHIEKEKRDVFMEAFNRVDGDIRTTFERMTGGSAWLEIENQEDIFSSGVTFMVRFPSKTVPRESTALSGGEKTIAATVFLLALQSLKPSPFYLMDEIDAHLDAQNTERLSKVLLERSKDNQIIMVTLKDATVAKAGLIFGIYPREGVSQLVRYKNPAQVPLANVSIGEATH